MPWCTMSAFKSESESLLAKHVHPELCELAKSILNEPFQHETMANYARLLETHALFKLDPNQDLGEGGTYLTTGLAVSPAMAARCANEAVRTHRFILGLHRAIRVQLAAQPEHAVSILYAGCGPWATLALPLLAHYSPSQLQFTLLEIHDHALTFAHRLIENLGLSEGVADYIQADACKYQIPEGKQPDIILSETMNVTLRNEPQVSLFRHLAAQAPHAVLIPERITVSMALVDMAREHRLMPHDHVGEVPPPDRHRIPLGEVFTLSRHRIDSWHNEGDSILPAHTIKLPSQIERDLQPTLMTSITVYGEHMLQDYDCSLTLPTRLQTTHPLQAGEPLHFYYQLTGQPGLVGWQQIEGIELLSADGNDRKKLPVSFDVTKLLEDLNQFQDDEWTDHFVTSNYEGVWQALPLRAQAGAKHPIQQICSHPGCDTFHNTNHLMRTPYFSKVLDYFGDDLLCVRLMKLGTGSSIKEHTDYDLDIESGFVRLHIPITTSPEVEFLLNGDPVVMQPGECWYLRLSDPHSLNNPSDRDRVHIVLDMKVNAWLSNAISTESSSEIEACTI